MTENHTTTHEDTNEQIAQRREKLAALREQGNAYPNHFRRDHLAKSLLDAYACEDPETLKDKAVEVSVAGRIITRRVMGKASFCTIQDMSGRIQLYLRRDDLPDGVYTDFKKWDIGDIVGAKGTLFVTKTGELSIKASSIELLTKSLRPLPEKFHGLTDQEVRYRQRYIDLIVSEQSRQTFVIRAKAVSFIRRYMEQKGFIEAETPMMQPIPGGASARPFETFHNALDMPLFLRIAPELYLKRLVVGGFEKVFEINRNFRNEGLSTRHNPEFTMIEFYQAYSDHNALMDLTEDLLRNMIQEILGSTSVEYQGKSLDFGSPFKRMTVLESIVALNEDVDAGALGNIDSAREIAEKLNIPIKENYGLGKIQIEIFEKTVESNLMDPTFITEYPTEVSPLARSNDTNPFVTDRFEFFVGGREIANGFSELNDPDDQKSRFLAQVEAKEAGDDEAMYYDEDYITALEYGMPPTAGEGIGIDRLVMLLTDSPSIRDVLLFPQMRPLKNRD